MRNNEHGEISQDIGLELGDSLSSYLYVKYGNTTAKVLEQDIKDSKKRPIVKHEEHVKLTRFGNGRKTWKDMH